MKYTPQTQWVGGEYPGAIPKHLHQYTPKYPSSVKVPQKVGHKRRQIIEYVRLHGPCSAVEVSRALQQPLDSVRSQLKVAYQKKQVTREDRPHPNGNNRIGYYSGVQ